MRSCALSGWGQPHDALVTIAPGAVHVDYAVHADIPAALTTIEREAAGADAVIGWSLGGLLAVLAMAKGILAPKRLVLIGTPYQFVKSDVLPLGMAEDTYLQFRGNYAENPARTLKKAHALIAHGDRCADGVQALARQAGQRMPPREWLFWLDALGGLSAEALSFAHFPPALLLHGRNDAVVGFGQAERFHARLPNSQLHVFEGCGHAPHWHDAGVVNALVGAFIHV